MKKTQNTSKKSITLIEIDWNCDSEEHNSLYHTRKEPQIEKTSNCNRCLNTDIAPIPNITINTNPTPEECAYADPGYKDKVINTDISPPPIWARTPEGHVHPDYVPHLVPSDLVDFVIIKKGGNK